MKWSIADHSKKLNEEREEEAGEGEPTRGPDSDGADESAGAGRDRRTEPTKKKKYYFQPRGLTQYPWVQYKWNAILCVYCRQCGPSIANDMACVQVVGVISDNLHEKTGDKSASAPYQ